MTQEQSAEQQARDLLERLGYEDAQNRTAGDLVELANLIASTSSAAPPVPPTRVDELRDAASDLLACYGPASDYAEPYLTKWARLCSALAALASPVGETGNPPCYCGHTYEQHDNVLADGCGLCGCDGYQCPPASPVDETPARCHDCGHQRHAPGRCLNMASDNGCNCSAGETPAPEGKCSACGHAAHGAYECRAIHPNANVVLYPEDYCTCRLTPAPEGT